MQYNKNMCEKDKMKLVEIQPKDGKKFLKWAKVIGCVWSNGDEINPKEGVGFTHFYIDEERKLYIVPISAWVSKQPKFKNVKKYVFNYREENGIQIFKLIEYNA